MISISPSPTVLAGAVALSACLVLSACSGSASPSPSPAPEPAPSPAPEISPPPWDAAPLRPTAVPQVLLTQWSRAENREICAPLAPLDPAPEVAEPRAATFGGGWGVAWDLPEQRSAFGVAGTGVEPGPDTYDEWPHRIRWDDGSEVGYGPEGGTGPNQMAYLRIPGQRCLYNVWSRVGTEHLEELIRSLRFVTTTASTGA